MDQVVAMTINQETLDLESEGEWPSSRVKCRYEHWFMGWCHLKATCLLLEEFAARIKVSSEIKKVQGVLSLV